MSELEFIKLEESQKSYNNPLRKMLVVLGFEEDVIIQQLDELENGYTN